MGGRKQKQSEQSKTENRKMIEKINKTKRYFFERSTTDKPLVGWVKKNKNTDSSTLISHESGDITTNSET